MLLNLSDVLTSEGKVESKQIENPLSVFESRMGTYQVLSKEPITFTFTNISNHKARLTGETKLVFAGACDRCLTDTEVTLALSFDRVVTSPEYDNAEEDIDDLSFMEGYQLNVETFMYNEVLENWPAKILCREDCKGVCPVCGQNLNEKECGCDTFVPDPRMAVLKDIFCADKEV